MQNTAQQLKGLTAVMSIDTALIKSYFDLRAVLQDERNVMLQRTISQLVKNMRRCQAETDAQGHIIETLTIFLTYCCWLLFQYSELRKVLHAYS